MRRLFAVISSGVVLGFLWFGTACESSSATENSEMQESSGGHRGSTHGEHSGEREHHGGKEQAGESEHHGTNRHGGPGGFIELTKKAQKRYAIDIKKAEKGSLADRVTAPAEVKHDPAQKQHVSPLVRGRVSELEVTVGDKVEKDDRLAVLRSIELGQARADVQKARSDLKVANADFQRVEKLEGKGIVSERRFLEAKQQRENARAQLEAARSKLQTYGVGGGDGPYYQLSSELTGRIIEQNASEGEVKGPEESLYVVADNSPVWVIGQVYERDISKVERGMKATVTLEAYPARTWKGTVDWVADTVDAETRNLAIRVTLSNKTGDIRPGMFGAVHLESKHAKGTAVVPVGAVQKVHGEQVVFVPGEKARRYRVQPVETGKEAKGLVEIRSGLEPGEKYVTRGAFDLKATRTAASRSGGHHH